MSLRCCRQGWGDGSVGKVRLSENKVGKNLALTLCEVSCLDGSHLVVYMSPGFSPQHYIKTLNLFQNSSTCDRVSQLGFLLLQQNTMTKKKVGEERIYWVYASPSLFITKGSQGRNLEAGAAADRGLLACSPQLTKPAFLQNAGPSTKGMAPPTMGRPFSIEGHSSPLLQLVSR